VGICLDTDATAVRKKKAGFSVLTLGLASSGKTTFAKQMKILHSGGFKEAEQMNFKVILTKNMVMGIKELVQQAKKLDLAISEENLKRARYFLEMDEDSEWQEETGDKLRTLWSDPAVQEAWNQSRYRLQVSMMDYHIENLDRYLAEGFRPTNDDILRARQRTTGYSETVFMVDKTEWTIIDCSGQASERPKWEEIMISNIINCIIYFVSLDEFNTASDEPGKNKIQLSLDCFREMVANDLSQKKTMILFLNKKDVLEQKFKTNFKEFQDTFPEYSGGNQDIKAATDHIGKQFRHAMKEGGRVQEELLVNTTCALDTDAMSVIFRAICETLFTNSLF